MAISTPITGDRHILRNTTHLGMSGAGADSLIGSCPLLILYTNLLNVFVEGLDGALILLNILPTNIVS